MTADEPAAELETLERTRLRALVDRDMEVATAVHADDYELITPGGAVLSGAAYLGSIADQTIRYDRFEPVGAVRALVHGDTAILRYVVRIEIAWEGGYDRGEFWHTDYWERRDGRWQAVWSQATRSPGRLAAE